MECCAIPGAFSKVIEIHDTGRICAFTSIRDNVVDDTRLAGMESMRLVFDMRERCNQNTFPRKAKKGSSRKSWWKTWSRECMVGPTEFSKAIQIHHPSASACQFDLLISIF